MCASSSIICLDAVRPVLEMAKVPLAVSTSDSVETRLRNDDKEDGTGKWKLETCLLTADTEDSRRWDTSQIAFISYYEVSNDKARWI